MCSFCFKVFVVSLIIFLFLIVALNYVGVMVVYIGVPLIVVCGWISGLKICKKQIKENIENLL